MNTNNLGLIIAITAWDLFWRGLALWKSARKEQKYWFIALLIVNSVGLLPIIYLLWEGRKQPKRVSQPTTVKVKKVVRGKK